MSLFANSSPFGQNNQSQQPQPQASNSLFGTKTTNQQSSAGSLFGSTTTTSAPSGGSLFGNNAQAKAPATGSLFGNSASNAASSQPSGTNSLFGGSTLTNNTQSTPAGGGLFGSTNNAQQQTKPTLSLWGTSTNQNQQQTQQQPSLFGTSTQPQQQQQQQQQAQQPQPQNSLFSNTTSTNTARPSLLPSLSLGQSTSTPSQNPSHSTTQQSVPGVRIDLSNLRGTTRFTDLHEDLQTQITTLDAAFAQQISYSDQISAVMPGHAANIATLPPDVDYIRSRVEAVETALDNDGAAIKAMKCIVAQDAEDARRSFRAIENLKLPQQFHYLPGYRGGGREPNVGASSTLAAMDPNSDESSESTDLIGFFDKTADEMTATLAAFTDRLAEIEQHMRGIESAAVAQGQAVLFKRERSGEEQVRELAGVLREFEGGILGVAGKVGAVRESVGEVVNGGFQNGSAGGNGNGGRR